MMIRARCSAIIVAIVTPTLSASAQSVTKTDSYDAWTLYADTASPHAFCFVTSEPTAKEPASAGRDAPRAYLSTWPKDGIKAEISFRMGFPVKATVAGSVRVGDMPFPMFSSETRLFVTDATAELKLIDAMKKGSELKIEATSERGTKVTDTYSLKGFGAAVAKMQELCRS
jgi:Invasion associated locus B (IalB) protein